MLCGKTSVAAQQGEQCVCVSGLRWDIGPRDVGEQHSEVRWGTSPTGHGARAAVDLQGTSCISTLFTVKPPAGAIQASDAPPNLARYRHVTLHALASSRASWEVVVGDPSQCGSTQPIDASKHRGMASSKRSLYCSPPTTIASSFMPYTQLHRTF